MESSYKCSFLSSFGPYKRTWRAAFEPRALGLTRVLGFWLQTVVQKINFNWKQTDTAKLQPPPPHRDRATGGWGCTDTVGGDVASCQHLFVVIYHQHHSHSVPLKSLAWLFGFPFYLFLLKCNCLNIDTLDFTIVLCIGFDLKPIKKNLNKWIKGVSFFFNTVM